MNESELIKKTHKDLDDKVGFHNWTRLTQNVWKVTADSKYWLLKTAPDGSEASRRLLEREYGITCGLQHPFIVNVISFRENTPEGPAILMEYVEGRTLRAFVQENPPEETRRKVLSQILDAVEYIHRKGVLHNDIKPENIMVTDIGNDVKIIDFGLSENGADYLNRRLGGTAGSSAPEVLSGDLDSSSTGTADIYSIGGIIRLLFPGKYGSIVRKCCQERTEDRYRDISSLRKAIAGRNRRPYMLAGIVIIFVLLAAALLPDTFSHMEDGRKEAPQGGTSVQGGTSTIQDDLNVFYNEAADSISNPELVPYMEFAYSVRTTFVNRTFEYRQKMTDQGMCSVCDSVYAILLDKLNRTITGLPSFEDLNSRGMISDAEEQWYLDLFIHNKPFEPFVKK